AGHGTTSSGPSCAHVRNAGDTRDPEPVVIRVPPTPPPPTGAAGGSQRVLRPRTKFAAAARSEEAPHGYGRAGGGGLSASRPQVRRTSRHSGRPSAAGRLGGRPRAPPARCVGFLARTDPMRPPPAR